MNGNPWERVRFRPEDTSATRYGLVAENGFGLLVAWIAGPEHLLREIDREPHTVTVIEALGGRSTRYTAPRTPADQAIIDQGIDDYLAEAGVPAPPRGLRWFQRVPDEYESLEAVYARINRALANADPGLTAVLPRDLARLLTGIVAEIYVS